MGAGCCYCMQVVFGKAWVTRTRFVFVDCLTLLPSGGLGRNTNLSLQKGQQRFHRGHHEIDINASMNNTTPLLIRAWFVRNLKTYDDNTF